MKKTKLYLPPKCEVVKVRTEQQFLASLNGTQNNVDFFVEDMHGYDSDDTIGW